GEGADGSGNVEGAGAAPAGGAGVSASPTGGSSAPAPDAPEKAIPPPLLPRAIQAPRDVLETPLGAKATGAGLTAAAQVMGTVQRLAGGDGAPRNAHGTLRIIVDADGTVSSVTTTSASWAGVAKAIRAALAGRRLRVPRGAHGVE